MPALLTPQARALPGHRSFQAIGTTAAVAVTDVDAAGAAEQQLHDHLQALDEACSRFRPDSEVSLLENLNGRPTRVSELLFAVVTNACQVALDTCGTVDPTVGRALRDLGYDRDFALVPDYSPAPVPTPRPAPGWWVIGLDDERQTIELPAGVHLDLGATAKAFAADRAAASIAAGLSCGVLVNIGGDVAVAGEPPEGGWRIGIADNSAVSPDQVDTVVAIFAGGLASSGIGARAWRRAGRLVHHIIDPATGAPAEPYWRLVSASGPTCVAANAASTAAVIWGPDAIGNLASMNVPARLVDLDGIVHRTGGWPE
jgi:thiamine biosynthesis lipoprotein